MVRNESLRMADDSTSEGEGNYPTCDVTCSASGCTRKCCKENTPTHSLYGTHVCSDHK